MLDDETAWWSYPHHRKWFNKLYLADALGYKCGPGGTVPEIAGKYIVRPIYNIRGMGLGTTLEYLDSNSYDKVPPGYFWCEYFQGKQYSATFKFFHDTNPYWKLISCWEAFLPDNNFSQYKSWKRSSYQPKVPRLFNQLSDVEIINIEFIDDKPFEVHLRDTPDPKYDLLIPIWESTPNHVIENLADSGYMWIEDRDDADGYLTPARKGFMVR
jgi:hypothetical protein